MGVLGLIVVGLGAFGLGVWLTLRSQRPRPTPPLQPQAPQPQAPAAPSPLAAGQSTVDPKLDGRVRDLVNQGRLIDAIKEVRAATGWSLGDAKAYVEDRLP